MATNAELPPSPLWKRVARKLRTKVRSTYKRLPFKTNRKRRKREEIKTLLKRVNRSRRAREVETAWKLLEKARALSPRHTAVRHLAADVLIQKGDWARAEEMTRELMSENPLELRNISRLRSIGLIVEQSPAVCNEFLDAHGRSPENLFLAASYLNEASFFDEAEVAAREGLSSDPDDDELSGSLGFELAFSLSARDRMEEAISIFEAIPANTKMRRKASSEYARCLLELGYHDKASKVLLDAGVYLGGAVSYNFILQSLLYLKDDIRSAHATYRYRSVSHAVQEYFGGTDQDALELDLTTLGDGTRSALVVAEGGPGDEIRFAAMYGHLQHSFFPLRITCDPRLKSLFERSYPAIGFIPVKRHRKEFAPRSLSDRTGLNDRRLENILSDAAIAAGRDSDRVFTTLDALADLRGKRSDFDTSSRLVPDPSLASFWATEIAARSPGRRRVGLAWRSMLTSKTRDRHYLSVSDLAPLRDLENTDFWVLQAGIAEDEVSLIRSVLPSCHIPDLDVVDDFEGQAALLSQLDAYVGPLTTMGELAGMVGTTPLLLCTTHITSWRQNPDGSDVWYPNGRLVKSEPVWDRSSLMTSLIGELREYIQER